MEIIKDYISNTSQTSTKNRFIVIHDTGNPNSTISNEVAYMKRAGIQNQAYVTHFIDDKNVVQTAPSGKISWGAGNINPYAYAQIEMVHVTPDKFGQQVKLLGELLKKLCSESGIPGYFTNGSNDGIITHNQAAKYFGGSNHTDPNSYINSRGWSMKDFQEELVKIINIKQPTKIEYKDLTSNIVPFNAKGVCWITALEGAVVYEDPELKKPKNQSVPYGSAWQIYGSNDGGVFNIGGYISQHDAVAKFNRGMGMGNYIGMTVTIATDDCYTQSLPGPDQPGVMHLKNGNSYKVINQNSDFSYVDLGLNQWVPAAKLYLTV